MHDVPEPVVDGPRVLGPQEVGQPPAAQVDGNPGVRQQVRVRPQQPQVPVEDGQADPALQEQFVREGVVLPPPGDQVQGRAEYEEPGRAVPRAVVQRQDAEADLQLAARAVTQGGAALPALPALRIPGPAALGQHRVPAARVREEVPGGRPHTSADRRSRRASAAAVQATTVPEPSSSAAAVFVTAKG